MKAHKTKHAKEVRGEDIRIYLSSVDNHDISSYKIARILAEKHRVAYLPDNGCISRVGKIEGLQVRCG